MKWDAAQTCQHSLLKCGDCRHKEKELSANGLAAVDAEVEAYRQKKLAEYWAIHQQAGPNPVSFPAQIPVAPTPASPLKLDLGCGNSTRRKLTGLKEKGFTGVDLPGTDGADVHCDLAKDTWPWPDSSVDEVNCAHMLEHIPRLQRVHFFNELYRVLKPRAKASIVTPHWCSCRAYGDITHEWPPVSEMFWQYLDKPWREVNAPHVGFTCDFEVGYGYLTAAWLQAEVANRNPEYVQKITMEAIQKYKEAAQDMHATLTARK